MFTSRLVLLKRNICKPEDPALIRIVWEQKDDKMGIVACSTLASSHQGLIDRNCLNDTYHTKDNSTLSFLRLSILISLSVKDI